MNRGGSAVVFGALASPRPPTPDPPPPPANPPVLLGTQYYDDRVSARSWRAWLYMGVAGSGLSPKLDNGIDHDLGNNELLQYLLTWAVPTGATRARLRGTLYFDGAAGETGTLDWQIVKGAWGSSTPAGQDPGGTVVASGNVASYTTSGAYTILDVNITVTSGGDLQLYLDGSIANPGGADDPSNSTIPVANRGGGSDFSIAFYDY